MDHLQRWHIFHSAIGKRNEAAKDEAKNESFCDEPLLYESFEARVYRNYKKMSKGMGLDAEMLLLLVVYRGQESRCDE